MDLYMSLATASTQYRSPGLCVVQLVCIYNADPYIFLLAFFIINGPNVTGRIYLNLLFSCMSIKNNYDL